MLTSLREIPAKRHSRWSLHYKADPTYVPVKDPHSLRWQRRTACGEFEILTTGLTRWYDCCAKTGSGGAIDLAMHLLQLPFVEVVKLLAERRALTD